MIHRVPPIFPIIHSIVLILEILIHELKFAEMDDGNSFEMAVMVEVLQLVHRHQKIHSSPPHESVYVVHRQCSSLPPEQNIIRFQAINDA